MVYCCSIIDGTLEKFVYIHLFVAVNSSLDSIVARLQTLKSSADVMLANSQGLNLNFTHQREFRFAQGNASEATAFLLKANSAFSNATLQIRQVDELSGNVSDLLASRSDRSLNATRLQNEIVVEQERLRFLLSNISTVQVSHSAFYCF